MSQNATVLPLRAVLLESVQRGALPSWCDLVVEEQDRWLVLGDAPRETDPEAWMQALSGTSVDDLLEAAAASEPVDGGSVLMRADRPPRLLAVVHDLDGRITVHEDWIRDALATIVRLAARTRIRGLALPILGGGGAIDAAEPFGDLLAELIRRDGPARLRIALLAPPGITRRVAVAMRQAAPDLVVKCRA
jgi:hypothetical protein